MNKTELEKMAFENSNDFELGGKIREIVNAVSSVEENWQEKFLSMAAEFDNFRKRVSKEKEELVIKTKTSMIEPILQVDNDIAIAAKHSTEPGIKLIVSKIETFLQSQGIQSVQTQTYDENIHEVINVVSLEQKGIVDVVSKGYSIGDKIIKYPQVVLSK